MENTERTQGWAHCRAELERSEARFRDVIERNADAIIVVDREGLIQFANPMAAYLFGTTREALAGSLFGFPMVAGETTEVDLLTGGAPRVVEMRVVESEWEGRAACIATLRDVTERKHAEDHARELIREQSGRVAAEAAARRFRLLADCSSILASSLEQPATFAGLAQRCVGQLADWMLLLAFDDRQQVETLELAHCAAAQAATARQLGEYLKSGGRPQPLLEWLARPTPARVQDTDDSLWTALVQDRRAHQLVQSLGARYIMRVPVLNGGRLAGAIGLVSIERAFDQQDLALAEEIGVRVGLALENVRLMREAKRANQTKSDFLAVISHDLRTPLASIIGYSDLMDLGIPEALTGVNLDRVARIRTAARHVLYLLDELLFFARLDAHAEQTSMQTVELAALVRDVSAVMEPLASERGLVFSAQSDAGLPLIETDPDKLRRVLVNLVANAVKYTEQGEVTLSVHAVGEQVAFLVQDTGVGIESADQQKIFEPFWQVDAARRSRNGGTGLGLSVVKRLVQLLDGEVSVQSAPGQGSTFTVLLPMRRTLPVREFKPVPAF